ncbi:CRISPR-associated helicase Cas3' [Heliobacterium gestii]|uniref:CRISPR-associated helicase Cas3 n=1 Tax=Heliomicrobium gestii TaxID=2699 RepID=A0A845LFM7_HELGE|nr:CRISPR-associated helicase Cas3' [Heliomicrobium gestii]MBM7865386.1 CRISPR-associated endonuclease/helicase Cas3 [Heliomicrobium gestii]MZP41646.1 CRISPR-associated helicase Cas3' [Heliomicrobium gestii]
MLNPVPTEETPKILKTLWAKSPAVPNQSGLGLLEHTFDVVKQVREYIRLYQKEIETAEFNMKRVLLYGALLHDLGKAHPSFQSQLRGGSRWGHRHEVLSLAFMGLLDVPAPEAGYLAAAIALHHKNWSNFVEGSGGSPCYFQSACSCAEHQTIRELVEGLPSDIIQAVRWLLASAESLILAATGERIAGYSVRHEPLSLEESIWQGLQHIESLIKGWERSNGPRRPRSVDEKAVYFGIIVRGLMISADHLASAKPTELDAGFSGTSQVLSAIQRSESELYPHQKAMLNHSGNAVMIAPTGLGKTEAALLWAAKQREEGSCGRILFLLPYRASMNAMATRFQRTFGEGSTSVVHGKSLLQMYLKLLEQEYSADEAVALAKQKESFARLNTSYIRVCSPYQLIRLFFDPKAYEAGIMTALNGQLVFDEIHAYEPAITARLLVTAKYLHEKFHARLLFMSATMPSHLLALLYEMFPDIRPPICPPDTMLAGIVKHRLSLFPSHSLSSESVEAMVNAARHGSVLVVVNTVNRAIELATLLREKVEDVVLIHSRFCGRDRVEKEAEISPRPGKILVATQVVEVSLDIDYDTGFFELAPFEALMQRLGRVNRKELKKIKRAALVYVFSSFENPTVSAYYPYTKEHLEQVLAVLRDFLAENAAGEISELKKMTLLDKTYPEALRDELTTEIRNVSIDFKQAFIQHVRPFGVKSYAEVQRLHQEWERFFDGYVVLPEILFEEAEQCQNILGLNQLMVPISGRLFNQMLRVGAVRWNNHFNVFTVSMPYNRRSGLELDRDWDYCK